MDEICTNPSRFKTGDIVTPVKMQTTRRRILGPDKHGGYIWEFADKPSGDDNKFISSEHGDREMIWWEKEHPNYEKLTFKDLQVGDKFIDFPIHGDNDGHGGYKVAYVLLIKQDPSNEQNALRLSNGSFTNIPDTMEVIKIQ